MKFYIKKGVICWNPKGWPGPRDPARKMARAKAESVPVREGKSVREVICRHNGHFDNREFYDVPDSEINKEWL